MARTKTTTPVAPSVSGEELVKAALNTPDDNTVVLNGTTFLLKDFKYRDYMAFVRYLAPMFDTFTGANRGISLESSKLNAMSIIEFCERDLPAMSLLVAHNTFPDMTEDELLDLAPSPFDLCELVLAQMTHNRIIEKLSGFLRLMTPRTTA